MTASRPWTAHYDAGVPSELTPSADGLAELLETAVRRFPDAAALSYFGRDISYWRLLNLCDALAGALQRRCLDTRRVALVLPNCPQFVLALLGALRAGMSVLALPPDIEGEELQGRLAALPCDTAVVLDSARASVKAAMPALPLIVTGLREYLPAAVRPVSKLTAVDVLLDEPDSRLEPLVRRSRAPLLSAERHGSQVYCVREDQAIAFSTTALAANARQLAVWPGRVMKTGFEKILAGHPLHRLEGLVACVGLALASSSTLVLSTRVRSEDVLGALAAARPSVLAGTTGLFADLSLRALAPARRSAVRSLRWVLSSGEPLDQASRERFEDLADCPVVVATALAETGFICATRVAAPRGTPQLPLPETDVQIVDEGGRPAKTGSDGWLAVGGPQCCAGPERPDGWVRTHVRMRQDEAGFLHPPGPLDRENG